MPPMRSFFFFFNSFSPIIAHRFYRKGGLPFMELLMQGQKTASNCLLVRGPIFLPIQRQAMFVYIHNLISD